VLRYEDLRRNTVSELEKILQFIGVPAQPEQLRKAVESNSLERMQAKEDKSPQDLKQDRFVRSGSVRAWQGKLTVPQLQLIDRHAGSSLAAMGYPAGSSQWPETSPKSSSPVAS
jgi:hypothetical protein